MKQSKFTAFSPSMTNILSTAVAEVLGQQSALPNLQQGYSEENQEICADVDLVLESFNNIGRLEGKYGKRGSLGLATRIGEASFRCFVRQKGSEYQLTNLEYRLMSQNQRFLFGLEKVGRFVGNNLHWQIHVFDYVEDWIWQISQNSDNRNWNEMWAFYFSGLIREYFLWTSGGRYYVLVPQVVHVDNDSVYQIRISKTPLGN